VAVTPDGTRVYLTHIGNNVVSVIDTATNTVIGSPIPVGFSPYGLAVTPDGSKVYVANSGRDNSVSVIDTTTDTVSATIPVGLTPTGVAVTSDGGKVYVANFKSNTVSVIEPATNTVIGSPIPVGTNPNVFGAFIQPAPQFAGVPGSKNCHGTSVSALTTKFGGLEAAAAALAFSDVEGLQDAIRAFCEE
jgi:YVTN family beta-propeller protein